MRPIFLLLTLAFTAGSAGFAAPAATFQNPVLPGDYPDPSIIRIGGDYYMTNSSLAWTPAFLIWHSRDLVHWEPMSYALPKGDGNTWAPDLVHRDGRFFIYYFSADGGNGNRVITADAITGPWSEPVKLDVPGIDPGIAFAPNGDRYVFTDGGRLTRLSRDGRSAEGPSRKVYDGWPIPESWRVEGFFPESPKVLFHDGYHYLTTAEGGTSGPSTSHMVVQARAKALEGPWENSPYNPIIHTRSRAEKWWSTGHGTVIDDARGGWWIVFHGYEKGYHTLGRQVLLLPLEWTKDGWLRVPRGLAAGGTLPAPPGDVVKGVMPTSDDFTAKKLGPQWQFWGEDQGGRAAVGDGELRLRATGSSPTDSAPLGIMARDEGYAIEADVEVSGGAQGGLVLFYDPRTYVGIALRRGELWVGERGRLNRATSVEGLKRARLRIVNDHQDVDLLVSRDGGPWEKLGASLNVEGYQHNTFGGFRDLRPGLFASGTGEATFRNFVYTRLGE